MLSRLQILRASKSLRTVLSASNFSSSVDRYDRSPGDLPFMTTEERILRPLLQAHRYGGIRPEDVLDEERDYHSIASYIKVFSFFFFSLKLKNSFSSSILFIVLQ